MTAAPSSSASRAAGPVAVTVALGLGVVLAGAGPRGAPPPPGPPPPLKLPSIEKFEGPDGLDVVLVTEHDQPLVRVALLFDDAVRAEPGSARGVSAVTARAMLYGEARGHEIDRSWLAAHVSSLGVETTDAYVGISFTCFSKDLADAFGELTLAIGRPTLRPDDVRGWIARLDEAVAASRVSAGRVGGERVRRRLLKYHRAEIDPFGNAATLRAMEPEAVREWYRRWFRPENATLLVVGDVTDSELKDMLKDTFGEWWSGDADLPPPIPEPQEMPPTDPRIVLLHRPGVVQSKIFVGATAPPAGSKELAATSVLAEILGGGIDSRLNRVLREERGDSYGFGSVHQVLPDAGLLWVSGAVDGDRTRASIRGVLGILDDLAATPVPEDELASAKAVLEGRIMWSASTTYGMLAQLQAQVERGRPPAELAVWIAELRSVTAEDVRRVAAKWLGEDDRMILVVGDAEVVREDLDGFGRKVEVKYRKGERPEAD